MPQIAEESSISSIISKCVLPWHKTFLQFLGVNFPSSEVEVKWVPKTQDETKQFLLDQLLIRSLIGKSDSNSEIRFVPQTAEEKQEFAADVAFIESCKGVSDAQVTAKETRYVPQTEAEKRAYAEDVDFIRSIS